MAQIGSAGSPLDIKLRQTTSIKNPPALGYEMQLVINSVQLLNQYLEVLRESLEGADSQDPSESMKFRRFVFGTAGQSITTGSVCCFDNDTVVKGVGINGPSATSWLVTSEPLGGTGTRDYFGVTDDSVYIALEDKEPGDRIKLGVPAGIIKLTGAKSGQLLWGAGARSVFTIRQANTNIQNLASLPLTAEGAIFLSNPIANFPIVGGGYNSEGYWMPGFPNSGGGSFNYNRNFLYPIGVCVLDGYALINPRLFSPSPPVTYFNP